MKHEIVFSLDEKHKIYIEALSLYKNELIKYDYNPLIGICYVISGATHNLYNINIGYNTMSTIFKEFYNYEVDFMNNTPEGHWWPLSDYKIRLKILNELVNITKPK